MSILDTAYIKFSITPEDKYQHQLMLMKLMQNTGQKSTKEVLVDELEVYFSSIKIINRREKV